MCVLVCVCLSLSLSLADFKEIFKNVYLNLCRNEYIDISEMQRKCTKLTFSNYFSKILINNHILKNQFHWVGDCVEWIKKYCTHRRSLQVYKALCKLSQQANLGGRVKAKYHSLPSSRPMRTSDIDIWLNFQCTSSLKSEFALNGKIPICHQTSSIHILNTS